VVHPGEGVFEIARRFGVDATALARTNGIGVNAQLAEGAELQVPGRLARMNALLTFVAGNVGANPRLVRAVSWLESGWRQDVISPTGAVGVMQIEPYTGDWVSRHLAGRRLDIWVAQDNVLAGSLLIDHLAQAHRGEVSATLAGYYQGDASVAASGVFDDTARYQQSVASLMERDA
jgi:soluble lytic murein transglycosylase-like protein